MNTLNAHLEIPQELQAVLEQIENMPLHLAELKMKPHPKFPQYDRYLVVEDLDVRSKNEFVHFRYKQILKDKETGEKIHIGLPMPEWVVYKDVWSYFRNSNNEIVTAPLKEGFEGMDNKVRTPSFQYMLFLMTHHRAEFLKLIQSYTVDFIKAKQTELDQYETI